MSCVTLYAHPTCTLQRHASIHAQKPPAFLLLRRPGFGPSACCRFARQRTAAVQARRQQQGWESNSGRGSRRSSQRSSVFRFKVNQLDVALAEDQLWQLALPFAALFGLAIFIGPLVVGLTLSAFAVGAAFSAGALAFTTLILPMLVLMGAGTLASFGLFAGLGAMLVLPKLVFSAASLAVVGGGLALGWGGVTWLLQQQSPSEGSPGVAGISSSLEEDESGKQLDAQQQQQASQIKQELRQFDELLEAKDRQRRTRQ